MKITLEIDLGADLYENTAEHRVPELGDLYITGDNEIHQNNNPHANFGGCKHIILKRKRWRAEARGEYYYITPHGDIGIRTDAYNEYDDCHHRTGNYLQYEIEAKVAATKWKEIFTP